MPLPQHLLVLLLENRSFDHVLGFLDHPDPSYTGLSGEEENHLDPTEAPTKVSNDAGYIIEPDPGHSHESVMYQLTGKSRPRSPYKVTNAGFLRDFERMGLEGTGQRGTGPLIMRCQDPSRVPILSALAKEFVVFDHWFCPVPGETWPNRNFAVAATSDGEVNIDIRLYSNPTIFEQLQDYGRSWAIYYDGFPQVLAFPAVWKWFRRKYHRSHKRLFLDIRENRLPNFAYIEPNHQGDDSNSQHPSNNTSSGRDFVEAENLICRIYEALLSNPVVWEKTALLITYDEHGGFFDHVPPPQNESFALKKRFRKDQYTFKFDLLGPRVPAILVSPLVEAGTVEHTVYEHSSIVRTTRELFIPGTPPLSDDSRDAVAASFAHLFSRESPRMPDALPRFDCESRVVAAANLPRAPLEAAPVESMDPFQQSLLSLAHVVEERLIQEEGARMRLRGIRVPPKAAPPKPEVIETAKDAERYMDSVVGRLRATAY
jgi:phospholipase C